MKARGVDSEYEHDVEPESKFQIVGETTPSGANHVLKGAAKDPSDDVKLFYEWGDRGAASQELSADGAARYVLDIAGTSTSVQAPGKSDESNYWKRNPEALTDDTGKEYFSTSLPNPVKTTIDGDIEVSAGYEDGDLFALVTFDTEYDTNDEEIQDGSFRILYQEPFESDAEDELERTQEALRSLENMKSLLE